MGQYSFFKTHRTMGLFFMSSIKEKSLWENHEDEEITPEQAHKNAVELAEHTKAWKGHEVLIATHIDKGHIHTHFIVNSVNYENGHKLQWM